MPKIEMFEWQTANKNPNKLIRLTFPADDLVAQEFARSIGRTMHEVTTCGTTAIYAKHTKKNNVALEEGLGTLRATGHNIRATMFEELRTYQYMGNL